MAKRPTRTKPATTKPAPADTKAEPAVEAEPEAAPEVEREPRARAPERADGPPAEDAIVRRHLAFGWWSLAVFTLLGLLLEGAHGLKLGWYLDVTSATRRLSFTLGHAHGTLLGLVNIAFAVSLRHTRMSAAGVARASFALRAATVLMPLGFLLAGVMVYGGDPGLAIVLVPPSGVLLIIAMVMIARGVSARK